MFQTGGGFCQRFYNIEGAVTNFRFYGTAAEQTTATSVALNNQCQDEPCCSMIWCFSTNTGGCTSVRYSVAFIPNENPAAALAAGIIAAIVLAAIVAIGCCAYAVYLRRKTMGSGTPPPTTVMVVNPGPGNGASAWGEPAGSPGGPQPYPPPNWKQPTGSLQ